MRSAVFIGIDLGWAARSPSGVAALRGDANAAHLLEIGTRSSDAQILEFILQHAADGPAIVAVDAPLQVPNEIGTRPGDRAISADFRRYQAGTYPANRRLLAENGVVRGEALVSALAPHGFAHREVIVPGHEGRQVLEVYPHTGMVGVFDLPRILRYKDKPRRSREERLSEWKRYQSLLLGLQTAEPALKGQQVWCDRDVSLLRGAPLKAYEDATDALFCAYIALFGFRWGPARCRSYGSLEEGYVFTPIPPNW
ncbi:MAG: DUF429 domain-containing protein [Candidatus Sericytochromatia bacterium]|nr:DUF429 domain-containing protein [Candidatus Sericytochromatia bacterium]